MTCCLTRLKTFAKWAIQAAKGQPEESDEGMRKRAELDAMKAATELLQEEESAAQKLSQSTEKANKKRSKKSGK